MTVVSQTWPSSRVHKFVFSAFLGLTSQTLRPRSSAACGLCVFRISFLLHHSSVLWPRGSIFRLGDLWPLQIYLRLVNSLRNQQGFPQPECLCAFSACHETSVRSVKQSFTFSRFCSLTSKTFDFLEKRKKWLKMILKSQNGGINFVL